MTDAPRPTFTPLMAFYGLAAVAGAVVTWTFNIQHGLENGGTFDLGQFIKDGFANSAARSLSSDLLIGATAFVTWLVVEARRLRMRFVWVYVLLTFLVAFAFAGPLFLLVRERHLQRQGDTPPSG